uniref:Macaca fascicularis brain cDNA clone: QflA-17382, similar to human hypothetical protein FLJ22353 (FLJ22353), mRNA, RefSeq: NM_024587.2 n=1 Tax=Macaca fascicularis TaxID=9541 RepID=I7G4A2_MACFA|nr:unnamed protein product [Macaca fascicularis]
MLPNLVLNSWSQAVPSPQPSDLLGITSESHCTLATFVNSPDIPPTTLVWLQSSLSYKHFLLPVPFLCSGSSPYLELTSCAPPCSPGPVCINLSCLLECASFILCEPSLTFPFPVIFLISVLTPIAHSLYSSI